MPAKDVETAKPVSAMPSAKATTIKKIVVEQKTVVTPSVPVLAPEGLPASNTLLDILARAYQTSPTLRAEREVLRQQYENVAQADANWRPNIFLDGGAALTNSKTDPGTRDTFVARDVSLNASEYLYRGGRTLAQVEQQLHLSEAAQAAYDEATQDAMLNVVIAAMDIQSNRAAIDLREKNREVLANQLKAAKNGFEVGELTRTDVAQSQARLSGAEADLVAAKADFANALARYKQYAGADGSDLNVETASVLMPLPAGLDSALSVADAEHPLVRAARYDEQASQKAISLARGALLPEVALTGTVGKSWNPSTLLNESEAAAVGVRASVPIYERGTVRSQVRQAKYVQYEKEDRIEETRRGVQQIVTTAWNDYQAALAQVDAYHTQVEAATLARNGVYKEREVGTRTILDTLNADAELLNAQVGLVRAQRDVVVAGYGLLAATGQLTGERLGFATQKQENSYLRAARANWFGTGTAPRE